MAQLHTPERPTTTPPLPTLEPDEAAWLDDLAETPAPGLTPDPAPIPAEPVKRLRRSRTDRVFGGVCGGLGQYLGIDPVLLRIAMAVLVVGAGTGVLLYLIAWIAIPEEGAGESAPATLAATLPAGRDRTATRLVVGALLVFTGLSIFASRYAPWWDNNFFWAAALIGIGLLIVARANRR
jgi:phage shock protein C